MKGRANVGGEREIEKGPKARATRKSRKDARKEERKRARKRARGSACPPAERGSETTCRFALCGVMPHDVSSRFRLPDRLSAWRAAKG